MKGSGRVAPPLRGTPHPYGAPRELRFENGQGPFSRYFESVTFGKISAIGGRGLLNPIAFVIYWNVVFSDIREDATLGSSPVCQEAVGQLYMILSMPPENGCWRRRTFRQK